MTVKTRELPIVAVALPCVAALLVVGCAPVIYIGKAIFGDPKIKCAFTTSTGVDLASSGKKVVVICTVPHAVESRYPSVASDILENITRRLKRNDIRVVGANEIQDWFDNNNGVWNGIDEVAKSFDADYAIHIELDQFTHRADKAVQMLQGKTYGKVRVYRLVKRDGRRRAEEEYTDEDFSLTHPPNNPVPSNRISEEQFLTQYIERISKRLAEQFYNHHAGETID